MNVLNAASQFERYRLVMRVSPNTVLAVKAVIVGRVDAASSGGIGTRGRVGLGVDRQHGRFFKHVPYSEQRGDLELLPVLPWPTSLPFAGWRRCEGRGYTIALGSRHQVVALGKEAANDLARKPADRS